MKVKHLLSFCYKEKNDFTLSFRPHFVPVFMESVSRLSDVKHCLQLFGFCLAYLLASKNVSMNCKD